MGATFSIRDDVQPLQQRDVNSDGLASGKRFRETDKSQLGQLQDSLGNWKVQDAKLILELYLRHDNRKHEAQNSTRHISWPELFTTFEIARQQKEQREVKNRRRTFHPACAGFAMCPDSALSTRLDQYASTGTHALKRGDVAKIHFTTVEAFSDDEDDDDQRKENHEDNGNDKRVSKVNEETHYDPKGAEKDDPEAKKEEAESHLSKEEDVSKVSNVETKGEKASEEDDARLSKETKNSGENKEDDVKPAKEASNSEEEKEKGVITESMPKPTESNLAELRLNILRKLPKYYDPTQLSPIFFTYTNTTALAEDKQIEEHCQTSLQEAKVDDKRALAIEAKMEETRATFKKKRENREKKRENMVVKIQRARGKERSKAKSERDAAKKMMGAQEFEHFMRSWQREEQDFQDKCLKEDQERIKNYFKEDQDLFREEKSELSQLGDELESVLKEANTPLGESLVAFSSQNHKEALDFVRELRVELTKRQLELTEARKSVETAPNNQTNRSMMLVAETEVKKANEEVDRAVKVLEERAEELRLAEVLREKESKYLVLFDLLASKDATENGKYLFSMDMFHVMVLMVASGSSALDHKIAFLCRAYNKLYPCNTAVSLTSTPNAQSEPATAYALEFQQVKDFFTRTSRAIERLMVLRHLEPASTEYLEDMVRKVFENMHICSPTVNSKGLPVAKITLYELQVWLRHTIAVSQDLASLFRVEWKYQVVSQLQRQKLFPVHKYRLGLMTLNNLNREVGRLWVTYREQLHPMRKLTLHERALAMGADDPLKPNYAKFLPKKKTKFFSNAVPLEHCGYGNIIVHHRTLALQMAVRLQSNWRARLGRITAQELRRRRLFNQAHLDALNETRAEVEGKYLALEATPAMSMERMKWDAKVRMKQVKLRAKGKKLEREQVVKLLMEQEVAVEQAKTNEYFKQMAVERGFSEADNNDKADTQDKIELAVKLPSPPKLTFKQKQKLKRKKAEKIKDQTAKEFIQVESLVKAGLDPEEDATYSKDLDIHGNPVPKQDGDEDQPDERSKGSSSADARVEGNSTHRKSKRRRKQSKRRSRISQKETRIDDDHSDQENAQGIVDVLQEGNAPPMISNASRKPSTTLPDAILSLDTRNHLLRKGVDLNSLYYVGMTPDERDELSKLRTPELASEDLMQRLKSLAHGMSDKKTFEMLQELPSKRLIFRFLDRFRLGSISMLEDELVKHFGLLRRDSPMIARCLYAFMDQDLDHGMSKSFVEDLVHSRESQLQHMVSMRNMRIIDKINNKLDHSIRTAVLMAEAKAADPTTMEEAKHNPEDVMPNVEQIRSEVESGYASKLESDRKNKLKSVKAITATIDKHMKKLQNALKEFNYIDEQWKCYQRRENSRLLASAFTDTENEVDAQEHALKDHDVEVELSQENQELQNGDTTEKIPSNNTKAPNLHFLEFQKLFECESLGLGSLSDSSVGNWSHKLSVGRLPEDDMDSRYNWVQRCRTLDELPNGTEKETLTKYSGYKALYDDFLTVARYYGHVLILEKHYPVERMTFPPTAERAADVGRTDKRYYWVIKNCHFKFASDDDGLYNGSEEAAVKAHANSIRNLVAFSKCTPKRVRVPLMALVELNGYAVLVSSHLPIESTTHDPSGAIKRRDVELVYGTADRGETIHMSDPTLHKQLGIVADKLNLAEHGVKGLSDLLPRHLHMPADLRGYRDFESEEYLVFNFRRLFPPESPDDTEHLVNQPRGHSIFWRQLRPELLKGYGEAKLSSDALTMFTQSSPDWLSRCEDVQRVTRYLVDQQVPAYAEELSLRSNESLKTMNLRLEMHRRGINMRHLGKLRSCFAFQLRGEYSTKFGVPAVICGSNPKAQVIPGHWICVKGTRFRVSKTMDAVTKEGDEFAIPLDVAGGVPQFGTRAQPASCGLVEDDSNSSLVRQLLLEEIVSRTAKNILKLFMRHVAQMVPGASGARMVQSIVAEYLNLLTGYSAKSSTFWNTYMVEGILYRYGQFSISLLEKENLRSLIQPGLTKVVLYVIENCGVHIENSVLENFKRNPVEHGFEEVDILHYKGTIKHSLHQYVFAEAIILAAKGMEVQNTSYEDVVLEANPTGYWPLYHRVGTRLAINRGASGLRMSGQIVNCELAVPGFVRNQWPDRAIRLLAKEKSQTEGSEAVRTLNARIEIGYHPSIVPQDRVRPFSVEAWVCPKKGKEGQKQTILMCGRYSLLCSRFSEFRFVLYDSKYGVEVELGKKFCDYEYDRWYHLVGTFDGTMACFYVNSQISEAVDVDNAVRSMTRARNQRIANEEIKRREEEANEKKNAEQTIRKQALIYFETKAGALEMATGIQKHISRSEARLKLNKEKAKILGWKKMNKDEARLLVVDEWVKQEVQKFLVQISERHEKQLDTFREDILRQVALAQTRSKVPLKIGSYSSSSSMVGGKNFFVGDLQHISVYPSSLSHDVVSKHYRIAKTDLELEADRWLKRATEKFRLALDQCHDDEKVLQLYAETMCRQAATDADRHHGDAQAYFANIRETLSLFESTKNADGIFALLKALPGEYRFAPLAIECWDAIQRFDEMFFAFPKGSVSEKHFRLSLLEQVPERFQLDLMHDLATSPRRGDELRAASEMYRYVLRNDPEFYQAIQSKNGVSSMRWIADLTTPSLICYFVSRVRQGDNLRSQNLSTQNFLSAEIPIIADNSRALETLDLTDCVCLLPRDAAVLLERCKFIRKLILDGCSKVDDSVLSTIGEFCFDMKHLSLKNCREVSDIGVVHMAEKCTNIRYLDLSHCELISDTSLIEVAKHLRKLVELHISWCLQISDKGLRTFAEQANPVQLKVLNLSAVRKVADNAVAAIAEHLLALVDLNLYYCNKVTDSGLLQATHSLHALEVLELSDLYQVTDGPFFFDRVLDGRPVADANMLTNLRCLKLGDCNLITDKAVGEIARRATRLEELSLNGCAKVTNVGIERLVCCHATGASRGGNLKILDLTFCILLEDDALYTLAKGCPRLESIKLSGCSKITDDGICELFRKCSGIQYVHTAHCRLLTDAFIKCMCDELWVEEVDISYCNRLTDASLGMLAENLTGITDLNTSWCRKFTDKGLEAICEQNKALMHFTCIACDAFSEEILEKLRKTRPGIQIQRK